MNQLDTFIYLRRLTRFGAKENNYGGAGPLPLPGPLGSVIGTLRFKKTEHEVQIDWRIVDNATREVVPGAAGRGVGVEKGKDFNFGSLGGGGFSESHEFMGSALGKATMKALAEITESVRTLDLGPEPER